MTKRPFLLAGLLGIAVLIASQALLLIFPQDAGQLPDGFHRPVLAFEFVRTPGEVEALFGNAGSSEQQTMIADMERGIHIDFIYMVLYSAFLALFAWVCGNQAHRRHVIHERLYYLVCLLALVVLAADVFENLQLLAILDVLRHGGSMADPLELLPWFTWLKWCGLCLSILILAQWFYQGNWISMTLGLVAMITFGIGMVAFAQGVSVWNEWMVNAVGAMFLLMVIYSFFYQNTSQEDWPVDAEPSL